MARPEFADVEGAYGRDPSTGKWKTQRPSAKVGEQISKEKRAREEAETRAEETSVKEEATNRCEQEEKACRTKQQQPNILETQQQQQKQRAR